MSMVFIFLSACSKDDPKPDSSINRTVLVYIAGDNSLRTFAAADLEEMIVGMKTVDVSKNNLLVYYDNGSSAKLIHFTKDKKGNVVQDIVKDYGDRNSVGLTEMREVFSDTFNNYTATSYGIVFWSHGDGWIPASGSSRWFGQDGSKFMNISTLSEALSVAPHLEFIFFDACFMQSIEVIYELRTYADYFVSSPTEIPAPGAPYQVVVPAMFVESKTAVKIASTYYEFHAGNYTKVPGANDPWDADGDWVAGVSTSVVVSSALDNLAQETSRILTKYAQSWVDLSDILCYDKRTSKYYYDLDGLMRILTGENEDYGEWDKAYRAAVPYAETTETNYSDYGRRFDMTGFRGVSTYIPKQGYSSLNSYYKTFQWYKAGGWENTGFIESN